MTNAMSQRLTDNDTNNLLTYLDSALWFGLLLNEDIHNLTIKNL